MSAQPRVTIYFPTTDKTFHLWQDPEAIDLGRGKKTGIEPDPFVSRNQVKVIFEGGKCFIERLGSNASHRNGEALPLNTRVEVFDGDNFTLLPDKYPFTITFPINDDSLIPTQPASAAETTPINDDDPLSWLPPPPSHANGHRPIAAPVSVAHISASTSHESSLPPAPPVIPASDVPSSPERSDSDGEFAPSSPKADPTRLYREGSGHGEWMSGLEGEVEFSDESSLLGGSEYGEEEGDSKAVKTKVKVEVGRGRGKKRERKVKEEEDKLDGESSGEVKVEVGDDVESEEREKKRR